MGVSHLKDQGRDVNTEDNAKLDIMSQKMLIILCGSKICIYIQNRDRLNLINAVKIVCI